PGLGCGSWGEWRSEPRRHSGQHGPMNAVDVAAGVDYRATLRVSGGDLLKALAQPFVECRIEPLKAVGVAGALCRPREPLGDRQIQDERQVGGEIAERETMQRLQFGQWQAASVTLIGDRRIRETVADDPD